MIPFKQDLIASKSEAQRITEYLDDALWIYRSSIQKGNTISRKEYCSSDDIANEVVRIMKNHGYVCTFSVDDEYGLAKKAPYLYKFVVG